MEGRTGQGTFIVSRRFDPDRAAVCLQDAAGNGQSQAGTASFEFGLAAGVQVNTSQLAKFFEDDRLVFMRWQSAVRQVDRRKK